MESGGYAIEQWRPSAIHKKSWVPDEFACACHGCGVPFGPTTAERATFGTSGQLAAAVVLLVGDAKGDQALQHHCQRCGLIFCADCTPHHDELLCPADVDWMFTELLVTPENTVRRGPPLKKST